MLLSALEPTLAGQARITYISQCVEGFPIDGSGVFQRFTRERRRCARTIHLVYGGEYLYLLFCEKARGRQSLGEEGGKGEIMTFMTLPCIWIWKWRSFPATERVPEDKMACEKVKDCGCWCMESLAG